MVRVCWLGAVAVVGSMADAARNEDFDDTVGAGGKNALVLFCSDFCPWCKNKLNVACQEDEAWKRWGLEGLSILETWACSRPIPTLQK